MKNFVIFMVKFITVLTVLAAIGYWLNYFLKATGKAELCVKAIKKLFSNKETADISAPTESTPQSSCNCNDAVCAVDMCMPY